MWLASSKYCIEKVINWNRMLVLSKTSSHHSTAPFIAYLTIDAQNRSTAAQKRLIYHEGAEFADIGLFMECGDLVPPS